MIPAKKGKAEILEAYEELLAENLLLKEEVEKGRTELTMRDYAQDVKRRPETHQIEFNLFVEDCGKAANWVTTQCKRVELPHWVWGIGAEQSAPFLLPRGRVGDKRDTYKNPLNLLINLWTFLL